jgi:hypothetical protein
MIALGRDPGLLPGVEAPGGVEVAMAQVLAHNGDAVRVHAQIELGRQVSPLVRRNPRADEAAGALGDGRRQDLAVDVAIRRQPYRVIRRYLPRCAMIETQEGPGKKEVQTPATPTVISGATAPYMGSDLVPMKKVRRELPQGSVLSPLVARAFLGRELRAVLGKTEVARLSFLDNLTLGARSRPKVEEALDALRGRLLGHPAGPVLLHVDRPTSTDRGRVLVFGYVLQPGRGYGNNPIHVCPGLERFDRFHRKLYDRKKAEGQLGSAEALEEFILGMLARWMPSQQAWTIVPVFSRNIALTSGFGYICGKEAEEFRSPSYG